MKFAALFSLYFFPGLAMASSTCNVNTYKPDSGVMMESSSGVVSPTSEGESNEQLLIKTGVTRLCRGLHNHFFVV